MSQSHRAARLLREMGIRGLRKRACVRSSWGWSGRATLLLTGKVLDHVGHQPPMVAPMVPPHRCGQNALDSPQEYPCARVTQERQVLPWMENWMIYKGNSLEAPLPDVPNIDVQTPRYGGSAGLPLSDS
jgi:hypothetical protein